LGKPEQFVVIRSGMDLERFLNVQINEASLRRSLGLPTTGPIVGSVMIFEAKKKPELIVEIAPKIIEAVPDVHFLLVGDGEMMATVRSRIQELKLQDRFVLTGLRQDVPELMALMDVFVHPAWFDVLPRAIVQALTTATPVVATHVGGIPEVVKDGVTGFLAPPRDLPALTEPIIRLLKEPELRARMGRAARESTSSAFTVEAMVKATEAVYNNLIAAKLSYPMAEQIRGAA
jgi:glycosyltransferase involved in cell wall biosynthesis